MDKKAAWNRVDPHRPSRGDIRKTSRRWSGPSCQVSERSYDRFSRKAPDRRTDGRTDMGQSIGPTSYVGGSKNDDVHYRRHCQSKIEQNWHLPPQHLVKTLESKIYYFQRTKSTLVQPKCADIQLRYYERTQIHNLPSRMCTPLRNFVYIKTYQRNPEMSTSFPEKQLWLHQDEKTNMDEHGRTWKNTEEIFVRGIRSRNVIENWRNPRK